MTVVGEQGWSFICKSFPNTAEYVESACPKQKEEVLCFSALTLGIIC